MKILTLEIVRVMLAEINVTVRKNVHGEFVVRRKESTREEETYYATDLADALATGRAMREEARAAK